MIEHNITRKLQERDKHRPDNEALSPGDAYDGAARLAAAMTFIKSFTLRAPHGDPDPLLGAGALRCSAHIEQHGKMQRPT